MRQTLHNKMQKISKEDKALWNLYTKSIKEIPKKINDNPNTKIVGKNLTQKKKSTTIANKNFYLDNKIYKALKKNSLNIDDQLDLHGLNKNNAKLRVFNFIISAFNNCRRNVTIITGKGQNNSGILKKETPLWLSDPKISCYIIGHTYMPNFLGGEGVIFIKIKNINKVM